VLERIKRGYEVMPRDVVTDGGYASLKNQEKAKERGVVNIVFNKIVGTLKRMFHLRIDIPVELISSKINGFDGVIATSFY
jgi:hypothetical protein